jgi:D-amino peptidase
MRVLVSADMEGTTGVTNLVDVEQGKAPYERFRRLLTEDVNAAIAGAFEGGATEVVVNDSHWTMRNVLLEELDPRAELITGFYKPLVMMEGVEKADLVFFTGYHSGAGVESILSHTFLDTEIVGVELNGQACSEARMNAAMAGSLGVPVGLVAGDDVICAEAEALFSGVNVAVTKISIDRTTARCHPPAVTAERIREAARRAVAERDRLEPYTVPPPYTFEIWVKETTQAAVCTYFPSVVRTGPTTVSLTRDDYREAFRGFIGMALMIASTSKGL